MRGEKKKKEMHLTYLTSLGLENVLSYKGTQIFKSQSAYSGGLALVQMKSLHQFYCFTNHSIHFTGCNGLTGQRSEAV